MVNEYWTTAILYFNLKKKIFSWLFHLIWPFEFWCLFAIIEHFENLLKKNFFLFSIAEKYIRFQAVQCLYTWFKKIPSTFLCASESPRFIMQDKKRWMLHVQGKCNEWELATDKRGNEVKEQSRVGPTFTSWKSYLSNW